MWQLSKLTLHTKNISQSFFLRNYMSASLPFYGAVTVFNLDKSVSFPTGGLLLCILLACLAKKMQWWSTEQKLKISSTVARRSERQAIILLQFQLGNYPAIQKLDSHAIQKLSMHLSLKNFNSTFSPYLPILKPPLREYL